MTTLLRLLYLLLLACVLADGASARGGAESEAINPYAASLEAIGIVPIPPDQPFEMADFMLHDGTPASLAEWRGRVTFINFWASWCAPCIEELPMIQRLYERLAPEGLGMIAINVQDNRQMVDTFVRELSLTMPIGLDRHGKSAASVGVRGLPVTYILDSQHRPLGVMIGINRWDSPEMVDLLRSIIASS